MICPQRESVLDAAGPVLVTGGPGSGKTTIALAKAQRVIAVGLPPGQTVLFLSFSRAAVARVVEASKAQLPKALQSKLSIQTFHSFFWEILKGYGYLLGAPRRLRLLLPHDEAAMRHQFESEGGNWETERERLFREEGLVAFDLFSAKAYALLAASARLRSLFSCRHPMIVVDEAQDTADDQWQCVRLLSENTQLVCLADLDQQIYDFRPGVSSERVTHIMEALQPLRVDLQGQNHRSPNSEIVAFANDMLLGTPRGSAYQGVSRLNFRANADRRDAAIRSAVGIAIQKAKAGAAPNDIENLALLATWGRGVNIISRALTGDGTNKSIPHRVMIDDASVLLSSRMVSFLLEPRPAESAELIDLADALDLAAAVFRARGGNGNLSQAQRLAVNATQSRAGRAPRANGVAAKLLGALRTLRLHNFSGEPKRDWIEARRILREAGANLLESIAKDAEQLVAFQRGQRIASSLTDLWQSQGNYRNARIALDAALAEDQLLSGGNDLHGILVMTVHKSKGKEFDAVIIFDDPNSSPLTFCPEVAPHPRCRRLLRVGITRARHHVLILTDMYRPSELLTGHHL
ncbi:MAG: ATP-dependent helicase [Candidatus Accumulibacter propinquus]|jgi:DNA helicase-2/ATP-dependent DNA helicase PcrA|uniref:ATP-dependent helicase n=1 Tax=Candidatus Accumulibacter propinquus TaxID=2954380 RepID=UPI002FC2C41E